jgi:hypothetical protein
MSLRKRPAEGTTELPDGREVTVRVEVPEDDYIPERELRAVALTVRDDHHVLAAITTVLAPEQEEEGAALVREALAGLSSGELEPTAGSLERLGDHVPDVRAGS